MIPIDIRSKSSALDGEIGRFAERRIHFAFDRLRGVRRVFISIEDVNGPKGGADKHCRIIAEFSFGSVVVDETRSAWQSAVARAIRRVARNAAREMQRINRRPHHAWKSIETSSEAAI